MTGYTPVGLGDIENTTLRLLQQSCCNYCHDITLKYFTIIDRAQHQASSYMCAIRNYNSIPLYWYESVGFNSSCWYKFKFVHYTAV